MNGQFQVAQLLLHHLHHLLGARLFVCHWNKNSSLLGPHRVRPARPIRGVSCHLCDN
jgi:hypothetical protein